MSRMNSRTEKTSNQLKRVCMLCHSYYPWDPRVRREAECLIDAGYSVDVLCLKKPGEPASDSYNGVSIYRLPIKRHHGSGVLVYLGEYVAFLLIAAIALVFFQLKRRYKVIQIHTLPDFLVFAALFPKSLGAKVILDMHEVTPEFFISKYGLHKDSLLIRMITWIALVSAKFADHVLTVSKPLRDLISGRGVPYGKISIVMNAANDNLFDPKLYDETAQPGEGKFRLIYHGAISELYDLSVVLRAIDILNKKIPEIELQVFGDGTMLDELGNTISDLNIGDRVYLRGSVSQEDIPREILLSNVGVVPICNNEYTDLALPTKLLEYIGMERPVVVSRRKTIERYFDDSSVKFFEPANEQDLAECIEELYSHTEKARIMVSNASKIYSSYRWATIKVKHCNIVNVLYGQ